MKSRNYKKLSSGQRTAQETKQLDQSTVTITKGINALLKRARSENLTTVSSILLDARESIGWWAAYDDYNEPSDETPPPASAYCGPDAAALAYMGESIDARKQVDDAQPMIQKISGWGEAWKQRIQLLTNVTQNIKLTLANKLVAYGGLFYLILPFDLIPDPTPVIGYMDDFAVLGYATAFYARKFPGNSNTAYPDRTVKTMDLIAWF